MPNKHDKKHDRFYGLVSIVGGVPLPKASALKSLKLLGNKIIFIESWLKKLENNYI